MLPPASLARFCVGPAAADQLGEQVGIILHARRGRSGVTWDAVEVAADPDMIIARDLGDMIDMVGDLARRCRPAAGAPCPGFERSVDVGLCWPVSMRASAALSRRLRSAAHFQTASFT